MDLGGGRSSKSLARLRDELRACLGSELLAGLVGESLDGLGIKSLAGPKGEDSRLVYRVRRWGSGRGWRRDSVMAPRRGPARVFG
jgi:hypothetical protein